MIRSRGSKYQWYNTTMHNDITCTDKTMNIRNSPTIQCNRKTSTSNNNISIGCWNVAGWFHKDSTLRVNAVIGSRCDIIGLVETHLRSNEIIEIKNYTWFGNNRKIGNKRAICGLL